MYVCVPGGGQVLRVCQNDSQQGLKFQGMYILFNCIFIN